MRGTGTTRSPQEALSAAVRVGRTPLDTLADTTNLENTVTGPRGNLTRGYLRRGPWLEFFLGNKEVDLAKT